MMARGGVCVGTSLLSLRRDKSLTRVPVKFSGKTLTSQHVEVAPSGFALMSQSAGTTYIESMDEPLEPNDVLPHESAPEPEGATLHRSATKKVFGGVAGGLADRFDVDANIVRVVFVVLALIYGLGIAIYLAMWALIPRAATVEGDVVEPLEDAPRVRWLRYAIPLGVVVLAAIFISTVHGLPVFGKSFALLWVIFLMVLAVLALFTPARRLTFRRLVALAFLAFISFVIVISGIFLATVQVLGVPLEGGSGVKQWAPTTQAEIQRNYHGAFGTSTINLSNVSFSGTTYVTATQGVGLLSVEVPPGVTVDLRTHVGLGDVQDSRDVSGNSSEPVQHAHAVLVLNLEVGMGQIQYSRECVATCPGYLPFRSQ
jgi:phage shock protein PspC (stress-responsive transcriptional regulator)